jgi:transcription antitermination factor NusG
MRFHGSIFSVVLISTGSVCAFQSPVALRVKPFVSHSVLHGKLWDKLGIEPDPMDEEAGWYVMNCVAGSEMELLAQAKHVTKDIPTELIEKIVVPTERKLRSHGKKQNVVEVKVRYPGYCFVKMRCCAETYEPLQQLPLCRSWMAGTVNQMGYKKLPPAPVALSDDEVSKFKGLEKESEKFVEQFGEDYNGRGDDGQDLIHQFRGYAVDNMVKILSGNFKGEDGVVKRIRDGEIMVRLFTYGTALDQWFKMEELRPLTDSEAMKGLSGPTTAINQDEFDVSIGKKPRARENSRGNLRSELTNSMGGGRRMRREDRVNRGEVGDQGLSNQQLKEEEENWRLFREEQRASQQQKRGDMWGIKERTSWDAGDNAATMDSDGKWKSGRQLRKEKASEGVEQALSGNDDWDSFTGGSASSDREDDFFSSLMSELSDSLDIPNSASSSNKEYSKENDFFASLMSELETNEAHLEPKSKQNIKSKSVDDDDFFANLEAELQDSLDDTGENDFFSILEDDLDNSLKKRKKTDESKIDDDFFSNLEEDLNETLSDQSNNVTTKKIDSTPLTDLSQLKVAELKAMLKDKGLKVSGTKTELIERLQES